LARYAGIFDGNGMCDLTDVFGDNGFVSIDVHPDPNP
jgi:hypothetical protein